MFFVFLCCFSVFVYFLCVSMCFKFCCDGGPYDRWIQGADVVFCLAVVVPHCCVLFRLLCPTLVLTVFFVCGSLLLLLFMVCISAFFVLCSDRLFCLFLVF